MGVSRFIATWVWPILRTATLNSAALKGIDPRQRTLPMDLDTACASATWRVECCDHEVKCQELLGLCDGE